MAEVVWADHALAQLDQIARRIALDKPSAAADVVARVFRETNLLGRFPELGRKLPPGLDQSYRMLWVAPCWIYYRAGLEGRVLILHVRRAEHPLSPDELAEP